MLGSKQSGATHVVGLILIIVLLLILWVFSHYAAQIGFLRQEEDSSQKRISDLETRIRVLETRALQEKIHEPIKIQP